MCVFTTVATNNTFFIYIPLSAYQRLQPRLILQESEPFIPYKALLIVLSSVSHTAAMSCTVAVGLHHAQNCTIFGATVIGALCSCYGTILLCDHIFIVTEVPVFSPDGTIISPRESMYLCLTSLISLRESLSLCPTAPSLFTESPSICA